MNRRATNTISAGTGQHADLTPAQLNCLRLAGKEQQSASHFQYATVRKLLNLGLIEGIGTGNAFAIWATDKGRELLEQANGEQEGHTKHLLKLLPTALEMAAAALPQNDVEWGSGRQVDADNAFALFEEQNLTPDAFEELETYALKATVEERVEFGLRLIFSGCEALLPRIVRHDEIEPVFAPDDLQQFYFVFCEHSPDEKPYDRGVVLERWKDGRFYFLHGNQQYIGTAAEVVPQLIEFLGMEEYL